MEYSIASNCAHQSPQAQLPLLSYQSIHLTPISHEAIRACSVRFLLSMATTTQRALAAPSLGSLRHVFWSKLLGKTCVLSSSRFKFNIKNMEGREWISYLLYECNDDIMDSNSHVAKQIMEIQADEKEVTTSEVYPKRCWTWKIVIVYMHAAYP